VHERARTTAVFSGGGTGGHLYPALAVADAVATIRPDVRVVFVGAHRGIEARVLPQRGMEHLLLPVEGFARGAGWRGWKALPALARSVVEVADLYARLHPEVVVVTGGYAGAPAGLAAAAMGVPLVLQEQNAVPGLTTRLLSRWARRIHVAFPEALERLPRSIARRSVVSGNPVAAPVARSRAEARTRFGLPADAPVVLVVGGSQGARALNRAVLDAAREVAGGARTRPAGMHLLWSTGPRHFEAVASALSALGGPGWVHAAPYIDDMPAALAAADIAVSRAGAMATSELAAWGVPSVLVPLPTAAADHQTHNARALASAGAATMLPETRLSADTLWREISRLLEADPVRETMREAALARARADSAEVIARDVLSLVRSTVRRGEPR